LPPVAPEFRRGFGLLTRFGASTPCAVALLFCRRLYRAASLSPQGLRIVHPIVPRRIIGSGPPMSALGQKQTWASEIAMSALPPKADIVHGGGNVRFVPKADILRCGKRCRYSITSSARPSSASGMVTPSALAVLRLTTSSTFTAC
jgi:hypothetical protein